MQDAMTQLVSLNYVRDWEGSATSFILHWQKTLRNYQHMCQTDRTRDDRLSDNQAIMFLSLAVKDHDSLRQIKATFDFHIHHLKLAPVFSKYFHMLKTAATEYDKAHGLHTGKFARNVHRPCIRPFGSRSVHHSDRSDGGTLVDTPSLPTNDSADLVRSL